MSDYSTADLMNKIANEEFADIFFRDSCSKDEKICAVRLRICRAIKYAMKDMVLTNTSIDDTIKKMEELEKKYTDELNSFLKK